MSKRGADVQGGRDGWLNNPAGNAGAGMDTPRRATAAQMAQRKIVRGRLARRPQNIGGSPIYDPPEHQQQMASPFTNINPNILSNSAPSNTDQQSQQSETSSVLQNGVHGGNIFGASQSFPQDNPSSTQAGSLSASFSGFQSGKATSTDPSAPNGSTFNFSLSTNVNNPFTPGNIPILHPKTFSGTEGSIGGGNPGFRGSIFNIPAGRDSVPLFAPIPTDILNNPSGEADKSTQPETTSDTPAKPSNIAQTPSTTNIFGQTAVQQNKTTPATTNIFGQSAAQQEKATPATTNIFGQTSVQPAKPTLATTNIFGQTSVQQDKTTPATTNLFGQSINSTLQHKSPSNVSVQSAEKMQISPDTTPAKGDAPKTGAFSFLSQPQNDTSTELNTQSGTANLFSKLSQPPSTSNPTPTTTGAATVNKTLFSGNSRPLATLKSASAAPKFGNTKGLFSGLLMPPSTPSPLASKQQPSTTAKVPFPGSLNSTKPTTSTQPPPSTAETPIQKEKLTNGVSKTTPFAQATGGSQTSNIFRNILSNSKAPAVEKQKEKLTNGVNGTAPVSQTNQTPQASSTFGYTPLQVQVPNLDKDDKFMEMPPPAPAHFTEGQKKEYVTLYRIRSLDLSFQKHITSMTELKPGDVEHAVRFYTETHEKIIAAGGLPLEEAHGNKRKFTGNETADESGSPAKKSKPESNETPTLRTTQKPFFSNIFNDLKGNSQAAVRDNSSSEAGAKKSKPDFEGTPAPQTNPEPPRFNILNNLKGNSQVPVTNTSFNGASAATPPKFSVPTFRAPTFGTGKPANFLAQFGQSVAESERKEKAKRKAEDFDSDEDDEAEWERKYAEEQRVKKQKLAEAAKGKTAKFVPGKGFVIEEDEQSTGATPKTTAIPSIFTPSTVGGASVFDSPAPQTSSMPNIFGHLSDTPPAIAPGRSLFDRISKDENGNNIRELPKNTANSLLAPSAATSVASSRATSPGITTDTGGESESNAEGAEAETTNNAEQLNLTTAGPGEEEEDVLFEVRAKALMWLAEAKNEQTKQGWQNKGIGPFRVLKHRKTGKARIIMRLDPSGRLVLNAALLAGVKYEHQAPAAVKMAIASEDGKLQTWVIKVKKDEDAIKLASILEESKSN